MICYFGTLVTNQNDIEKNVKGMLSLENVCHHWVENLVSFRVVCKNTEIKTYDTMILPIYLYESEALIS
jgi:hypothetical protein